MRRLPVAVLLAGLTACSAPTTNTCASGCAGCCDATGQCLPGKTVDACGSNGTTCVACAAGKDCLSGACLSGAGGGGGTAGGGPGGGTGGGAAGGGGGSRPDGGSVLFTETFEDTTFTARGWYDGTGSITAAEHVPGSAHAFECTFTMGATGCAGGTPARHKFAPSSSVYVGLWIKFSANWVGSGVAYHPHMFHFATDSDGDYLGPATSHLTTYLEVVQNKPLLALQDSLNVDPACVLRNDDSFVGCNGNFSTYPFTENRSVCSCNGLAGDLDGRDCFSTGTNTWYSARLWHTTTPWFQAAAGAYSLYDWHYLEAYYELNSVQGGVGQADGKIRLWVDGQLAISSDRILFRTGAHATERFNQFMMLPYIGVGSPVTQSFWVDDLTVATAPP